MQRPETARIQPLAANILICPTRDRLEHIRATGVTALMLTPVTLAAPGDGALGRAPVSYFAPDPAYAVGADPGAPVRELRQLVRRLHEEGLEVLLQVS